MNWVDFWKFSRGCAKDDIVKVEDKKYPNNDGKYKIVEIGKDFIRIERIDKDKTTIEGVPVFSKSGELLYMQS